MAAFDPAPSTLKQVTDPAWLSAMLSQRWSGATVRDVETVETLITVATKVRLKLDVADNADAPSEICIKGILTENGTPAASIVETLFYRDLREAAGVRVPACVHADLSADGGNGVLVMRDVIAAGGRFCSALEPFTPDAALDGLEQLARLHVAGRDDGALYATPWVPRFLDRMAATPFLPQATLQELLDGVRGEPLPREMRDAARLEAGVKALAAQVRERPNCLVHGDAHAGNVYRDAAGGLGVVDWQVLQKGEWAQDVAYHLAAVLTPEDRRAHERRLLGHYLDMLRSLGGPAIDPEAAWTRYRAAMIYGFYLWAITRKVDPPIINEFVRRLGLAASELESYAVVGA